MENEKSNINKRRGWIEATINLWDLGHRKYSIKELQRDKPKTISEFDNDLRALLDEDSTPRSLVFFQEHPLLHSIVPVLKEKLQTHDLSVELFIEIALLLSKYPLLVDEDLIFYMNSSIYDYYEEEYRTIIMPKDCDLLNELTRILEIYLGHKGNVQCVNESLLGEQFLISKESFLSIIYEELYLNEAIYKSRILTYFCLYKTHILLADPFIVTYLNTFTEENRFKRLYDELCIEGNVAKVVTDSGKISHKAVLERTKSPIALCYVIALDKQIASNTINDKWITDNMPILYINAFRSLWWDCSFYAIHKEKYINEEYVSDETVDKNFLGQVKFIKDCIELSTGERPCMPADYLLRNNINIDVDNNNEEIAVAAPNGDATETSVTDNADNGKNGKNYNGCEKMADLLIGIDKEKFLSILHEHIDGKGGKMVAVILQKAFNEKKLLHFPSEALFMKEFDITTTWEAVRKHLDSTENKCKNSEIHYLASKYEDLK